MFPVTVQPLISFIWFAVSKCWKLSAVAFNSSFDSVYDEFYFLGKDINPVIEFTWCFCRFVNMHFPSPLFMLRMLQQDFRFRSL